MTLVGSRTTGRANALSDWDYAVETKDFETTARGLEALARQHPPLAAQWDPFPSETTFMLMLPGTVKVDFIFNEEPPQPRGAWDPARDSLEAIELHFWDWVLWLGSKALKQEGALVRAELDKMFELLLRPLGAEQPPSNIGEAIAQFATWRRGAAAQGANLANAEVGDAVTGALREAGVIR